MDRTIPRNVKEVLAAHPWPEESIRDGRPLEFFWQYEFDAPVEEVWAHYSDTHSVLRRLGLAEVKVEERDGITHGRTVVGGVVSEWTEQPWDWTYCQIISYERVFTRGPIRRARTLILFEDRAASGTRLAFYTGIVPSRPALRWLVKYGTRKMIRRHREVTEEIRGLLTERGRLVDLERPPRLGPAVTARLKKLRTDMIDKGLDSTVVDHLIMLVLEAPDDDLRRIRVRPLARAWGQALEAVLHALLVATRAGLFRLSWDLICPHCRGAREEIVHLGQLPPSSKCEACDLSFDVADANSIEVTFRVHESIREVDKRLYCTAEPAQKPHIKLQETVSPGVRKIVRLDLTPGRYRLRVRGSNRVDLLDVSDTNDASAADSQSQVVWESHTKLKSVTAESGFEIVLHNTEDVPRLFVLEEHALDRDLLRPVDLFGFQSFRDLFTEEAVATGMQLDVGVQTVVFTDMVGSTAFYEREGDAAAFAAVRDHFVHIYEAVRAHHGAVVKTIGDAAMAAFASPLDAVKASVAIQRVFYPGREDIPVHVRISMHKGPCLAVNLNAGIDYFGRTVNRAAKLQRAVESHQVVLTDDVLASPGVRDYLSGEKLALDAFWFEWPWTDDDIGVQRFKVGAPTPVITEHEAG